MVDMFELVLPEKVAAEVVQKDVKLIYDPATKELVQMVMPFMTAQRSDHSDVGQGLGHGGLGRGRETAAGRAPHDVPAARRRWVAREIVKDVKSGRAKFILNTGDMVWWGKQGDKPSDNPYWKLVNEDVLKQLPPPDRADARRRAARARFPRRRQSRSVGRLRRRRLVECFSLFEKVRGFRQTTHLQVRLQRRPLHFPVDRQIRLSRTHGVGVRPGPRTKSR